MESKNQPYQVAPDFRLIPPQCTWAAVVEAVRKIGEVDLSKAVAEKYCGREKEEETTAPGVPDHQTQKQEIHVLLQQRLQSGDSW